MRLQADQVVRLGLMTCTTIVLEMLHTPEPTAQMSTYCSKLQTKLLNISVLHTVKKIPKKQLSHSLVQAGIPAVTSPYSFNGKQDGKKANP